MSAALFVLLHLEPVHRFCAVLFCEHVRHLHVLCQLGRVGHPSGCVTGRHR